MLNNPSKLIIFAETEKLEAIILGKFKDIFKGEHRKFAWFAVISTTLFVISWLVGPGNTIIHWVKTKREMARQEKQMEFYRQEIEQMNRNIDELKNNRDTLEEFAREHFNFAVPGEDVYIVE